MNFRKDYIFNFQHNSRILDQKSRWVHSLVTPHSECKTFNYRHCVSPSISPHSAVSDLLPSSLPSASSENINQLCSTIEATLFSYSLLFSCK